VASIGLDPAKFGTHSLRRTKAVPIYRRTGDLRAVQRPLGHSKIDILSLDVMSYIPDVIVGAPREGDNDDAQSARIQIQRRFRLIEFQSVFGLEIRFLPGREVRRISSLSL